MIGCRGVNAYVFGHLQCKVSRIGRPADVWLGSPLLGALCRINGHPSWLGKVHGFVQVIADYDVSPIWAEVSEHPSNFAGQINWYREVCDLIELSLIAMASAEGLRGRLVTNVRWRKTVSEFIYIFSANLLEFFPTPQEHCGRQGNNLYLLISLWI